MAEIYIGIDMARARDGAWSLFGDLGETIRSAGEWADFIATAPGRYKAVVAVEPPSTATAPTTCGLLRVATDGEGANGRLAWMPGCSK